MASMAPVVRMAGSFAAGFLRWMFVLMATVLFGASSFFIGGIASQMNPQSFNVALDRLFLTPIAAVGFFSNKGKAPPAAACTENKKGEAAACRKEP